MPVSSVWVGEQGMLTVVWPDSFPTVSLPVKASLSPLSSPSVGCLHSLFLSSLFDRCGILRDNGSSRSPLRNLLPTGALVCPAGLRSLLGHPCAASRGAGLLFQVALGAALFAEPGAKSGV